VLVEEEGALDVLEAERAFEERRRFRGGEEKGSGCRSCVKVEMNALRSDGGGRRSTTSAGGRREVSGSCGMRGTSLGASCGDS
jgi:hypothetical protein